MGAAVPGRGASYSLWLMRALILDELPSLAVVLLARKETIASGMALAALDYGIGEGRINKKRCKTYQKVRRLPPTNTHGDGLISRSNSVVGCVWNGERRGKGLVSLGLGRTQHFWSKSLSPLTFMTADAPTASPSTTRATERIVAFGGGLWAEGLGSQRLACKKLPPAQGVDNRSPPLPTSCKNTGRPSADETKWRV